MGRIVLVGLHTVNRAFWLLIVCMGCQVGRPPPSAGPFKVQQVIASSAEPGLKDAPAMRRAASAASGDVSAEPVLKDAPSMRRAAPAASGARR